MREARTLGSWAIALFLVAMFAWVAIDTLAPQPPVRNHLFEVFAASSGVAFFEPTGRFGVGVLLVLSALLILLPFTRRIGAVLAVLLTAGLTFLIVQLMLQQIPVPVDAVADGKVVTTDTDASGLFYLIVGLLVASVALVVIHPGTGSEADGKGQGYYGH